MQYEAASLLQVVGEAPTDEPVLAIRMLIGMVKFKYRWLEVASAKIEDKTVPT